MKNIEYEKLELNWWDYVFFKKNLWIFLNIVLVSCVITIGFYNTD